MMLLDSGIKNNSVIPVSQIDSKEKVADTV